MSFWVKHLIGSSWRSSVLVLVRGLFGSRGRVDRRRWNWEESRNLLWTLKLVLVVYSQNCRWGLRLRPWSGGHRLATAPRQFWGGNPGAPGGLGLGSFVLQIQ